MPSYMGKSLWGNIRGQDKRQTGVDQRRGQRHRKPPVLPLVLPLRGVGHSQTWSRRKESTHEWPQEGKGRGKTSLPAHNLEQGAEGDTQGLGILKGDLDCHC